MPARCAPWPVNTNAVRPPSPARPVTTVGDYAENGDIRRPTPHSVSSIYRLCTEGRYREISEWVRPLLAAELGVKYVARPWRVRGLDGKTTRHLSWEVRHDPRASFSVLEPPAK